MVETGFDPFGLSKQKSSTGLPGMD